PSTMTRHESASMTVMTMKCPTPTETRTLSLHDALPIYRRDARRRDCRLPARALGDAQRADERRGMVTLTWLRGLVLHRGARLNEDRKSTRLNSSHLGISYAVFCSKKKNPTRSPSGSHSG